MALTAHEVYLAQRLPDGGTVFATQKLAEGTDPADASYHTESSRAIASALRRGKFVGKDVVSALPMQSLQYKTLRMPPMPDEDLVQAIAWEAAERFQFTDEQVLQHYGAGQVKQGSELREEVILLAAERATVHDHASAIKRSGLMPLAIDATGAALARLLGAGNGPTLIVHMGEAMAEIVGTRGTRVIFDKPINLTRSGNDIDSAALGRELGLCLRYLSVTFGVHKPDAVYLAGQGATHALGEELAGCLPAPIALAGQAPALAGVVFPGPDPSPWLIPLGLALRGQEPAAQKEAA
ncbi:MAG: type IV pilus biogenesis protein PilM [Phycisphaeraceae bacterium]